MHFMYVFDNHLDIWLQIVYCSITSRSVKNCRHHFHDCLSLVPVSFGRSNSRRRVAVVVAVVVLSNGTKLKVCVH